MARFLSPAPFVRSFSFPDSAARVKGGCAVMVADGHLPPAPFAVQDDADELVWTDAQTAAFLAGEPLTLSWVGRSSPRAGSEQAYICCWVTIDND